MNLKLYRIKPGYITYLVQYAPHLFWNKKMTQKNERKFVGIVLEVNGLRYFAPLSSYKEKHNQLSKRIDCIGLKDYAVINLNNMFPVPEGEYFYVEIGKEKDLNYRALLQAEYRVIKAMEQKIVKCAAVVYRHKLANGNKTPLARRCNDFLTLEEACRKYVQ